ncbi:MAG: hypothetical protein DMD81_22215 [Candidatus Rokuibacteriota bacterium]|nr:MAG: hypothetical protein DMD81_22215 [Candidatus Rokubacteria bacterium]
MGITLLVVTGKSGEIVGICQAPPSSGVEAGPYVTIAPASPEYRLHELEVPPEVMEITSPAELARAVARYLRDRSTT